MNKKMDALTKAKLIYSCELGIFAIVFIVLAILKATGVLGTNATRLTIFNWITLFGGTWLIVDFFWALLSKKRQQRIALIDKCIHLPAGIYLIAFDLYCIISKPSIDGPICRYGVPIVFAYLGLCYAFEAIYHFYYPVPTLFEAIKEEDDDEKVVDEQAPVIIDADEIKAIKEMEEKEEEEVR